MKAVTFSIELEDPWHVCQGTNGDQCVWNQGGGHSGNRKGHVVTDELILHTRTALVARVHTTLASRHS